MHDEQLRSARRRPLEQLEGRGDAGGDLGHRVGADDLEADRAVVGVGVEPRVLVREADDLVTRCHGETVTFCRSGCSAAW